MRVLIYAVGLALALGWGFFIADVVPGPIALLPSFLGGLVIGSVAAIVAEALD